MDSRHVMLSYPWEFQETVKQVYYSLTERGFHVWMDIMGGLTAGSDINATMAASVERSVAIVCFMCESYENSDNCKKELSYADRLKRVIIIPCLAQGGQYVPSGWLGILTSSLLYIDFTVAGQEAFDEAVEKVIERLKCVPMVTTTATTTVPMVTSTTTAHKYDFSSSTTSDSPPGVPVLPMANITDPLLYHFRRAQEEASGCSSSPLKTLRSSVNSIPSHIVHAVRQKFRTRASQSESSASSFHGNSGSCRGNSNRSHPGQLIRVVDFEQTDKDDKTHHNPPSESDPQLEIPKIKLHRPQTLRTPTSPELLGNRTEDTLCFTPSNVELDFKIN